MLIRRSGPTETLRHVLLHEFTHVRHRDPLLGLLLTGLNIVYWFHPLVWMVRTRLETLRMRMEVEAAN